MTDKPIEDIEELFSRVKVFEVVEILHDLTPCPPFVRGRTIFDYPDKANTDANEKSPWEETVASTVQSVGLMKMDGEITLFFRQRGNEALSYCTMGAFQFIFNLTKSDPNQWIEVLISRPPQQMEVGDRRWAFVTRRDNPDPCLQPFIEEGFLSI